MFLANTSFATDLNTPKSPQQASLDIIKQSLEAIKILKSKGKSDIKSTKALLNNILLPNIDVNSAAKFALKKHWSKMTSKQRDIFKRYLLQSIISDYANIISVSDSDLSQISLSIGKKPKLKNNKAIVNLLVKFDKSSDAISFSLRMVNDHNWRIYDFIFSGVSLMKGYRARFDSQIKRRGIEALTARLTKSL